MQEFHDPPGSIALPPPPCAFVPLQDRSQIMRSENAPFWSVMIPVYKPDPEFLKQTLECVLQQDPGPAEMQIEILADNATSLEALQSISSSAGDRVTVSRLPNRLGLAGCWNECILRARGEWIHLLHQDDIVFPGFYRELRNLSVRFSSAAAAFSRYSTIDAKSAWLHLSPIESHQPCLLPDWHFTLTTSQRIQCPSIVVRRGVYLELGGFRSDIPYCLDWEMWTRIAEHHPVAHTPKILAGYRLHGESESSRLGRSGADIRDMRRTFDELVLRLPADRRKMATKAFSHYISPFLIRRCQQCYVDKQYTQALQLVKCAQGLSFSTDASRELRRLARYSRIKRLMRSAISPG